MTISNSTQGHQLVTLGLNPSVAEVFSEVEWEAKCEEVARAALDSCGCSHTVYRQRVSFSINTLLNDLPVAARARAIEIAVLCADYATAEELEQEQLELAANGYCCHGMHRDSCPAGCGDFGSNTDVDTECPE